MCVAREVLGLLLVWPGAHVHGAPGPDRDQWGGVGPAVLADGGQPVDRGVGKYGLGPSGRSEACVR